MSVFEAAGIAFALGTFLFENCYCVRSTAVHYKRMRTINEELMDVQRLLEQAQSSLEQLEKQPHFDISGEEDHLERHLTKSVTTLQESLCSMCGSLNHELSLHRHLLRDQGNCGRSLEKFERDIDDWKYWSDDLKQNFLSRKLALPEIVASKGCEIKFGRKEETMTDKPSSHVWFSVARRCEDLHRSGGRTRQSSLDGKMSVAQVVRLAGGMFMLYPACMLVMGNYAVENGSFGERDSWVTGLFRQPQDMDLLQGHGAEGISMAHIVPDFVTEPSAPLFFVASMTWAFLEWAHYQSNVEDEYQMAVLGVVSIIGFLPALGCAQDMLSVALCTVPFAMHFGLLISHVLHRARRADNVQTRDCEFSGHCDLQP